MALEIGADKREELKDHLYKYWPDTIEVKWSHARRGAGLA